MAYATLQNLIDRFGEDELIQLTDRAGLGVVDALIVTAALDDATSIIDSYTRNRYAVPIDPVPSLLVRLVGDIARYYLHDEGAPDRVEAGYTDAVKILRDIASGKVALDVAGVEATTTNNNAALADAPPRIFTRDSMKGF